MYAAHQLRTHADIARGLDVQRIVIQKQYLRGSTVKRLEHVLECLCIGFDLAHQVRGELVLEHRAVANWQKLLEHLLADKEILAGVRLKFSDLNRAIEGSSDATAALETFLGELPAPKKTH